MTTDLKHKRRKQILNAALEVFIKKGFHTGTVEDIANNAGLGKGTIYEYFNSKQDIFEQMILNILNDYLTLSQEITLKESSVRDKLLALLKFNKIFLDKNLPIIEQSISGLKNTSKNFNSDLICVHNSIFQFIVSLVKTAKENEEINTDYQDELIAVIWISIIKGVNNSDKIFNIFENTDPEDIVNILFNSVK